jgi:hypothetical protein
MVGETKQLGSRLRFALLVLVLVALARPVAAVAEDPPFVGWSSLLPGLSLPYDVTSPDDCIAGRAQCVDKTVREMTKRFEPLASTCDHNAIFSLTYLRVTEEYRRTVQDSTFFDDTPFVNYEDGIFARYYFSAYDAWKNGQTANVPVAWRIAFDAARNRAVSAYGDLLLGINAHVQRDLPFVLYSIGLVTPDGASRKPDHDRVNQILNRAYERIVRTIGERYDPLLFTTNASWNPVDNVGGLELVKGWREGVWRNAERLLAASSPEERKRVADSIELNAATWARGMAAPQVPGYRAQRDAYCAAQR